MPLTPGTDGMHVCIFENFQLEGDLPYGFKVSVVSISLTIAFHKGFTWSYRATPFPLERQGDLFNSDTSLTYQW